MTSIKNDYFFGIQNFGCQFVGFLLAKEKEQHLAQINMLSVQSSLKDMQYFFGEIAEKHDCLDEHIKLCDNENAVIKNLVMACEYYRAHEPEKYFNKFQIKTFYEDYCKSEMEKVKKFFEGLQEAFSIIFPNQIYISRILKYYPVILKKTAIVDEVAIERFLVGAIEFADAPFEFLTILLLEDDGRIARKALQISRETFRGLKSMSETGGEFSIETIRPAYLVDVSLQILDCFNDTYSLADEIMNDANSRVVGDVLEELWIYSKLKELLVESEDKVYYLREAEQSKEKIKRALDIIKADHEIAIYEMISNACEKVFSGTKFDDALYNKYLEALS